MVGFNVGAAQVRAQQQRAALLVQARNKRIAFSAGLPLERIGGYREISGVSQPSQMKRARRVYDHVIDFVTRASSEIRGVYQCRSGCVKLCDEPVAGARRLSLEGIAQGEIGRKRGAANVSASGRV